MPRATGQAVRVRTPIVCVLVASALCVPGLASPALAAAEAQLRIQRGPYYVGDPIELHLQVKGLARAPEPTCEATAPSDTTLTLAAIVPTVASSVRIIGGRIQRTEDVTFTCQYVLVASRAGVHRLGAFEMTQGSIVAASPPHALTVDEIPLDPRIRVRVTPASHSVYKGQQVPVRIEWWLDESLDQTVRDYAIRSALFDDPDTFRFIEDDIATRGDHSLEVHTAAGEIALAADVETRTEGERRFLVISANRRMVPLRTGRHDLAAATVNVDEVTSWQRDIFGSRRPGSTHRLFARDAPLTLTVRPTPAAGRPDSFGGAIGRGFSLDVAADRSVVQLGDPITLTLTVRGEGHLATVGLPPLAGPSGLPVEHFRLSEEDLSGEIAEGAKQFQVSVRALDEGVHEIPAIEYAWFDPDLGEYQTTRSRPIALSVRPAEVVSASDVVVAHPSDADGADSSRARPVREPGGSPQSGNQRERGSRSLIGADLSIERSVETLAKQPTSTVPAQVGLYAVGVALLAGAGLWRRRARTPPRVARIRAAHKTLRSRIDHAATLPPSEALGEVASALRELAATDTALRSAAVDAFLRECDEIAYAPTSNDDDVRPRIERARALADAMLEGLR